MKYLSNFELFLNETNEKLFYEFFMKYNILVSCDKVNEVIIFEILKNPDMTVTLKYPSSKQTYPPMSTYSLVYSSSSALVGGVLGSQGQSNWSPVGRPVFEIVGCSYKNGVISPFFDHDRNCNDFDYKDVLAFYCKNSFHFSYIIFMTKEEFNVWLEKDQQLNEAWIIKELKK